MLPSPSTSKNNPPGPFSTLFSRLGYARMPRLALPIALSLVSLLTISYFYSPSSTTLGRILPSSTPLWASGPSQLPSTPWDDPEWQEWLKRREREGRRDPWMSPTPALPLDATLEERLDAWELDSPRGEGAQLVAWSAKTCPSNRISPNQNKQQLEQSHLLWSSMNSSAIVSIRQDMISFLREAKREGRLDKDKWGEGRGLAFTAGNADTFSRVLLTLKLLRTHLNTRMPAEIFSFPGEAPPEDLTPQFAELNATLRIIEDEEFTKDSKRSKNYQLKASAILRSRFREVMYLDSDNLPAAGLGIDPSLLNEEEQQELLVKEERKAKKLQGVAKEPNSSTSSDDNDEDEDDLYSGIFESKAYKRLGVMFWPDYFKTSPDNPIWMITGVQCRDEWEQEAGVIMIDKSKHLDALLLAEWILQDWKFFFNFSDGDKDVFRYAFLALRKRWGVPGKYISAGALPRDTMSGFCGHTMLQSDHLGKPMFVHMNLLKQIPSGVGRGFSWGRSRALKGFQEEGEEEYVDYDIDADMLANAQSDGTAISPASPAVKRRAAIERGIRHYFHGGWISALCIDMKWEDPRTAAELTIDKERYVAYAAKHPDKVEPVRNDNSGEGEGEEDDRSVAEKTTIGHDGMQIKWESPLEVRQWSDDPRLKDFEERFYNLGGSPNGKGF